MSATAYLILYQQIAIDRDEVYMDIESPVRQLNNCCIHFGIYSEPCPTPVPQMINPQIIGSATADTFPEAVALLKRRVNISCFT